MTRVILVRHGRTTANAEGILAGRQEVELDDQGRLDAQDLGYRLSVVPIALVLVSPLVRTRQTADAVLRGRNIPVRECPDLIECDYGDWSGRPLADLVKDDLWSAVQLHPSGVTFPDGESMAQVAARSVAAVRAAVAEIEAAGSGGNLVVVSHGDVIKAIIADALGLHLDGFQRICVDPGSLSVVRYTPHRVFVEHLNDLGGTLESLRESPSEGPEAADNLAEDDAVPGGGTGR